MAFSFLYYQSTFLNQWYITYANTQVAIPQEKIQQIFASLPHDILVQVSVGNEELLKDYIAKNIPLELLVSSNTSLQFKTKAVEEKPSLLIPNYMIAMNRMRQLRQQYRHTLPMQPVIDKVKQEMRALQLQGNKSHIENKIRQLEEEKKHFLSRKNRLTKQIEYGKKLLEEPIMKNMFTIRSGSLHEAEVVIEKIKSQWPYNV